MYYAASLERGSEHPLGRAIIKEAEKKGVKLSEPNTFVSIKGLRVKGMVNRREVYIGKLDSSIVAPYLNLVKKLMEEGKTIVALSLDGKVVGLTALIDDLKDDATLAVRKLKEIGLKVIMLTDDNRKVAMTIARKIGIEEVYAEVKPEEKVGVVSKVRSFYGRIAMVGGWNK